MSVPVPVPAAPRPPAPLEDVFAGIEAPAPPAPRPPAAPVMMPPPDSSGPGKTILIVSIVVFLLAAAIGASVWAYQDWRARKQEVPVLVPAPVVPTSTVRANTITPPPITVDDSVPFPSDNPQVEIIPLPTPVTEPPGGASVPPPTAFDPNAPYIPTSPTTATSTVPAVTSTAPSAPTPSPSVQFDTDGDGLTDVRERELGTDTFKADTDGDTASDGEEVLVYGTNPLNIDTDADGFPDGVEIKNGFNPRGTGRCQNADCKL